MPFVACPLKNKPVGSEIANCRPFLAATIGNLPNLRAIVALGRIAHESTLRALALRQDAFPFGHARRHEVRPGIALHDSYHCSRYNTSTRRLTPDMFRAVFEASGQSWTRRDSTADQVGYGFAAGFGVGIGGPDEKRLNTMSGALVLWRDAVVRPAHNSVASAPGQFMIGLSPQPFPPFVRHATLATSALYSVVYMDRMAMKGRAPAIGPS